MNANFLTMCLWLNYYHFGWRVENKIMSVFFKESSEPIEVRSALRGRIRSQQVVLACLFQMLETGSRSGSQRGLLDRGWSSLRCLASSTPKGCWSSLDRTPPQPGCPRWSRWPQQLSPFWLVYILGKVDSIWKKSSPFRNEEPSVLGRSTGPRYKARPFWT